VGRNRELLDRHPWLERASIRPSRGAGDGEHRETRTEGLCALIIEGERQDEPVSSSPSLGRRA